MVTIDKIEARKGFDTLEAEVVSVSEPRQVRNGELTLCDAQLKDKTGTIKLTLWNDEVEKVKVGDKIKITKGWANEYQGEISVSAGKFGTLEILESNPKKEKKEKIADEVKMAIDEDII